MKSKEEILASKLDDILSDIRVQSYLVGRYFAQIARAETYDNFEEMIESAKQEKQNRIKWLEEIIKGEDTVETDFDRKCQVLSDVIAFSHIDKIAEFLDDYDTLAICWSANAYVEAFVDGFTGYGVEQVNGVFSKLLDLCEVEDSGFDFFDEIVKDSPVLSN
jgi:alpha-N-acetylglucosamine transferase